MKPARLKSCWSLDQKLFEANAHKLPKYENHKAPAYLRQTCAALLKRRTFKGKTTPPAAKKAVRRYKARMREATKNTIDDDSDKAVGESSPSADAPGSCGTCSPISWQGVPVRTSRQLVRSWPVRADREPESPDSIARACEKIKICDEAEPKGDVQTSSQSHPAIVEFKELLAKLRGRRPKTIADLAEAIEFLWCKGNLADLGNLDKMWSIVVANPEIDLGAFLVR